MNIRNLLICTALAFAPACSKGPDAMMDKMVGMMEEMGDKLDQHLLQAFRPVALGY